MPSRDPLLHALARVARRVRVQRALERGAWLAAAGLGTATLGLALVKVGFEPARGRVLLAVGAALPLVGVLVGVLQPVPPLLAARLVDRAHDLRGLCASGWSFLALAPNGRSRFAQACLERAEHAAAAVVPARALPFRLPRAARSVVVLALAFLGLAALEVPKLEAIAPPPPERPSLVHEEDLAALREEVAPLARDPALDPALAEVARELESLLDALADRELDRLAALRRLADLAARLPDGQDDEESLEDALRALGAPLARDSHTAPLAEALAAPDPARAAEETRSLARRLGEASASERARMKDRFASAASAGRSAADERRERRLEQLEREERREAQAGDGAQEDEKRLLDRKRDLERLRREVEREREARREVERLQRDLDAAAGALGRDAAGEAGEALERAAQELDRMGRNARSAAESSRMRERLAQMGETLRSGRASGKEGSQGAASGTGKRLALSEFGRAARGESSDPSGKAPDGALVGGAASGEGRPIPAPGSGTEGDEGSSPAAAPGGRQAGLGGSPEQAGEATALDSKRVDTRITGERGAGPTRSEVILDASRRGFASERYREVHEDYREHAEQVLEHDEVPPGYRFYVRRYFQLIRPREAPP